MENIEEEIERLKKQLEKVKQQDKILEEIEIKLNQMKMIAPYARNHELSDKALGQLNKAKLQSVGVFLIPH